MTTADFTLLLTLQEAVRDFLLADEFLASMSVIVERDSDIEAEIDEALSTLNKRGGKIGLCAIVMMPGAESPYPNSTGPELSVLLNVQVIEDKTFNSGAGGTQIPAEQAALYILHLLHHWQPLAAVPSFLAADQQAALTATGQKDDILSYAVQWRMVLSLPRPERTEQPLIALAGALPSVTATITSATAGADIYTTTDGSFPSPANPAAALYTAPLTLTEACTLAAAAYKTNLLGSSVAGAAIE